MTNEAAWEKLYESVELSDDEWNNVIVATARGAGSAGLPENQLVQVVTSFAEDVRQARMVIGINDAVQSGTVFLSPDPDDVDGWLMRSHTKGTH